MYFLFGRTESEKILQTICSYADKSFHEFVLDENVLFNTARTFYTDSELKKIYYGSEEEIGLFYQATKLQQRLRLCFNNLAYVNDVIIYIPKFDYVITYDYIFTNRAKFYELFKISKFEDADWLTGIKPLSTMSWASFISGYEKIPSDERGVELFTCFTFPMVGDGSFEMVLLVARDGSNLVSKFIYPEIGEDAFSILRDRSGNMIACKNIDESENSAALSQMHIINFGESGYTLQIGISDSYFSKYRRNAYFGIAMSIVAAMLSSFFVSAFFVHRSTSSIGRIIDSIDPEADKVEGNEMLRIEDGVNNMKSDISSLKESVRKSLIEKLFFKGISDEEVAVLEHYYGNLPKQYTIASFCAEGESGVEDMLLQKIGDRMTKDAYISFHDQRNSVMLISCQDADPIALSRLLRAINQESKIRIWAGLSHSSTDYKDAYKETIIAQRRLASGPKMSEVNVFTHTHGSRATAPIVNVKDLDILQQSLMNGDFDSSNKLINHIFEEFRNMDFDEVELRQLFFSLRAIYSSVLTSYMIEEELSAPDKRPDIPDLPNEFENYSTYDMEEFFISLNEVVFKNHENRVEKKINGLAESIVCYVRTNFSDKNLCAAVIADKFGISEKYVFKLFRDATGRTLNSSLSEIRIAEAIRLLRETDVPVSEIALKAGFSSSNSMYKVFIREKGVTPTAYRMKK